MRATDILGLALSELRQHRVRTALTTLGVVFGALVLTASISIGLGVQQTIRSSASDEALRHIEVWPDWRGEATDPNGTDAIQVQGQMSEARRERIRRALARRKTQMAERPRVVLSQANIAVLRSLTHVETVMPFAWQDGYVVLDGRSESTEFGAARPGDAVCRRRIVAGRLFGDANESAVVVSEALLYLLGVTDESAVDGLLGRKLRIETRVRHQAGLGIHINHPEGSRGSRQEAAAIEKFTMQLPQVVETLEVTDEEREILRKAVATRPADAARLFARELTIVGVMRAPEEGEQERRWDPFRLDGDAVLPVETAADIFLHLPGHDERGMHKASLIVDREENVESVLAGVRKLGFEGYAPLEQLKRMRLMYLLIFSGTTCVAIVSLLVAGLGIANTMLISVLQRTREIGIMKAVGADSWHLQLMFLVEGALIGCVGGALGLLLAWVSSFPSNAWVQSMASRDLKIELGESIWVFPIWLPLAVFFFALAVTIVAAVYPSRRAARIDPVAALRYE